MHNEAQRKPSAFFVIVFLRDTLWLKSLVHYQRINPLAHVNPEPKAAMQTRLSSFILPCSQASHKAIGMEAAVVLPYCWILLWTWSSRNPSFCWTNCDIRKLAWWGIRMVRSEVLKLLKVKFSFKIFGSVLKLLDWKIVWSLVFRENISSLLKG